MRKRETEGHLKRTQKLYLLLSLDLSLFLTFSPIYFQSRASASTSIVHKYMYSAGTGPT